MRVCVEKLLAWEFRGIYACILRGKVTKNCALLLLLFKQVYVGWLHVMNSTPGGRQERQLLFRLTFFAQHFFCQKKDCLHLPTLTNPHPPTKKEKEKNNHTDTKHLCNCVYIYVSLSLLNNVELFSFSSSLYPQKENGHFLHNSNTASLIACQWIVTSCAKLTCNAMLYYLEFFVTCCAGIGIKCF